MSKTYIVSRNGGTVSKAPVNDNKIPIYANETALDADLANIPDNTIVATKGGHDDVIDQMKEYIRNQNVLSDWENITISTDSNNPTVFDKDGFYTITYTTTQETGERPEFYVNGVLFTSGFTAGGNYNADTNEILIPFKKGDSVYMTARNYADLIAELVAYYKLRDYTGR